MDFFISTAMAQGGGEQGNPLFGIIFLVLMMAIFWFLLIRPQQKRQKAHQKMVTELSRGDEVVTNGGVLGRVTAVGETFITLEVSKSQQVRVQKNAVANVMPKGTIKEQEKAAQQAKKEAKRQDKQEAVEDRSDETAVDEAPSGAEEPETERAAEGSEDATQDKDRPAR
ncbi:protein translocase subunit yajC [Alkalilimnicola ehrlichii MLHE-1]|uniref:Sec translocon accessory complex subunit YajC n=1 Tax=Alkalilimnicola ehrlichii (strain ATCC BAA-1101 / DSM 17681 / MLHE-1) TaxID=187272 RepID=Q0A9C1_ALKEH|nr:preprotein translocase subunit YajC [Alkalilimnicola ehrlichii]ABI56566.1 protein translocase subunit yajC [Alkalilimnicola ehrlichii MLHE-1]